MKILVAGAGAIGGLFGAKMHAAGLDTTLLVRAPTAEAVAASGLQVSGLTTATAHLPCVTKVEGLYDLIIITAKAHATSGLAEEMSSHLNPDGVLASIQNGLGNEQKLVAAVGADRVAVAITSHGVTVDSPGVLRHAGVGPTFVGPAEGAGDSAAKQLHDALEAAGVEPQWKANMRAPVWTKAIINAGLNPVGALFNLTNGAILDDPEKRNLGIALANEAAALAQLARVDLGDFDAGKLLVKVLEATRENKCSMLQDVAAKRPTEIEQITGRMVRLNEKLLGHMPRSEAVYGRIKALEASYLGEGPARQTARDELDSESVPF